MQQHKITNYVILILYAKKVADAVQQVNQQKQPSKFVLHGFHARYGLIEEESTLRKAALRLHLTLSIKEKEHTLDISSLVLNL